MRRIIQKSFKKPSKDLKDKFQRKGIDEPPKNDAVKINFDGAFNEAERVGGIGVIIRDVIISKPYIRS